MQNYFFLLALSLIAMPSVVHSAVETEAPLQRDILVVVGTPGTDEFDVVFKSWADNWKKIEEVENAEVSFIGLDPVGEVDDKTQIQNWFNNQPKEGQNELWLVFIGHGTFDGTLAKVNLRGSDVSSVELSEWLTDFQRPLIIIDSTSSSGPFVNELSAEGRIVISAAKSGYEMNYSRFGGFFSEAILDPAADRDRDGQTSLLEAFLSAGASVEEFYISEGRLTTEHALLDDNSDQLGTQANWFRGIRPVKKPVGDSEIDGLRAHQIHLVPSEQEKNLSTEVRNRRNELELLINGLRDEKADLDEEDYYEKLEVLLVELAYLYQSAEVSYE